MELKNPTSFTRNFIHTHTHAQAFFTFLASRTYFKQKINFHIGPTFQLSIELYFCFFLFFFFWIYELCVCMCGTTQWNSRPKSVTKKKSQSASIHFSFSSFFLDSCSSSSFESLMLSTTTFHFKNRNYFHVLRTSTIQNETNKEYTE